MTVVPDLTAKATLTNIDETVGQPSSGLDKPASTSCSTPDTPTPHQPSRARQPACGLSTHQTTCDEMKFG